MTTTIRTMLLTMAGSLSCQAQLETRG
jgi:hypothetical protein